MEECKNSYFLFGGLFWPKIGSNEIKRPDLESSRHIASPIPRILQLVHFYFSTSDRNCDLKYKKGLGKGKQFSRVFPC